MNIGLLAARMDTLGGVEVVVLRTARYLTTQGYTLRVVTTVIHPQLADALGAIGVEVRLLGREGEVGRYASLDHFTEAAAGALQGCEAIQVHNFPAHIWAQRARARLGDAVLIYTCQEPPRHLYESTMDATFLNSRFNRRPWYTRWWDHAMGWRWRLADQTAVRAMPYVLTNSRYTADKIKAIYGYSAIPCYFAPAPPPVRPPRLEPSSGRGEAASGPEAPTSEPGPPAPRRESADPASASAQSGTFRILFAGRLTLFKNVRTCIEAVARLPKDLPVEFEIIGTGDEGRALESFAQTLGCAQRVRFLGLVSEEALEAAYARCDTVLYIPFDEPMGLVPMEAAWREVCAVVSNHAGPSEIVVHERTGLHVDATRPEDVAAALLRLARDPALCRRLGQAARQRIEHELPFELYTHTLSTMLGSTGWQVPTPPTLSENADPLRSVRRGADPESGSTESVEPGPSEPNPSERGLSHGAQASGAATPRASSAVP